MADVSEFGAAGAPFGEGALDGVDQRGDGDDRPGREAEQHDGDVIPGALFVLVEVGGEAFEVVLEEEDAEEDGVAVLDGDEPGQHHGEIEDDAGNPDAAAQQRPFAAQSGKAEDDRDGHKRRDRAFGESGGADEEVKVEEPEFAVGFIPGVPAEHADTEWRGELHVGRCAAGESDDAGAGGGDEGRVELASGAEAAHVQVDEDDQGEGEAGRGQAGGPIVNAEFPEGEHGAPVIEGRFFEPGLAVEDRGDEVVAGEHFAGDLGVARLIGADQPEGRAAEDGNESIKEEKGGQPKESKRLQRVAEDGGAHGDKVFPAEGRPDAGSNAHVG